ncbi:ROK family protein [Senegalia massiliensis]|uniref:ROK family protein n=1 Tax=Senegalia massiliensis TaxID=1720316 RepID=UPI001031FC6F|nr:ROK family protein [Senegalia massiliensis]
MFVIGYDIGGTKTAFILSQVNDSGIKILQREEFKTTRDWKNVIGQLMEKSKIAIKDNDISLDDLKLGISCGGPLDNKKGLILSPPNLPGWDNVPVVDYIHEKIGVKPNLQNDADACALAEWRYGAGVGYENLIFLTFGTGLGAGLILNNKLYTGASNMAGEVGHIRLEDEGPIGYGKSGSFEGFCSGGGIAQLAQFEAKSLRNKGLRASFDKREIKDITTKDVSIAAELGNKDALDIFKTSGRYFGKGLSILIDILNPEIIVAGSIYKRAGEFLKEEMYNEIEKEALKSSSKVVKIVPAMLGEEIGDYGAIVTALG